MKKILSISLIFITFFFKDIAYAEQLSPIPLQKIQINPIISELSLVPGQDTIIPLTIKNLSNQPLGIHAQIADVQEDSIKKSPIIRWTHLSTSDSIMGAQEQKTISISIHTPLHTPNSGYAEIIYLTPFVSNTIQKGTPVVLSRIGALILGTVGKLNYDHLVHKVSLASFSPSSRIVNHTPVSLSFEITNKYFTYFTAKPFLTLTPLFGKSQTTPLEEHHILPGTTRNWTSTMNPEPFHFLYFAHLAVSVGNGKQLFADTFFIIFPYKPFLILIGSLLLFSVLLLSYYKRHRFKKAVRILLQGK